MKIYRNLIILFLFLGLYFACGRNPTEPPLKPDVRTIRGNAPGWKTRPIIMGFLFIWKG